MKVFITLIAVIAFTSICTAQDFTKAMGTAKAAYSAGRLEDAHFALQQAMQEVDLIIGKEVLKLLPAKMDVMEIMVKDDNVASNVGYIGATVHRVYQKAGRKA